MIGLLSLVGVAVGWPSPAWPTLRRCDGCHISCSCPGVVDYLIDQRCKARDAGRPIGDDLGSRALHPRPYMHFADLHSVRPALPMIAGVGFS